MRQMRIFKNILVGRPIGNFKPSALTLFSGEALIEVLQEKRISLSYPVQF